MHQPVIIAAKRTPVGKFFGGLAKTPSPQLGAYAIEAVLGEVSAAKDHIDEAIFGCVLQAGLGQNPARQAGLKSGLPDSLNAQTINKVCGSGLQSVMLAAQSIKAGDNQLVLAGGFENMTAAPHYAHLRNGAKFGEVEFEDHMKHDGLTCAFETWGMTNAADHTAKKHNISREEQDRFSVQSHNRAAEATEKGWFANEIHSLTGEQVGNRKDPSLDGGVCADEGIRADSSVENLARLRTVPGHEYITAGNASQISDGAAALIVSSEEKAKEIGAKPMATILDYYTSGVAPKDIFDAPAKGVKTLLQRNNLSVDDIDLFEINEAFAAQVLANAAELGIDEAKLNPCGGGVALGHPIGASGARVLTTLLHQMQRLEAKRGVASLCLGGGNSVSMLVQM